MRKRRKRNDFSFNKKKYIQRLKIFSEMQLDRKLRKKINHKYQTPEILEIKKEKSVNFLKTIIKLNIEKITHKKKEIRNMDIEKRKETIKSSKGGENDKTEKEEEVIYINQGDLGKGGFGVCYIYESTKDWEEYAAKIVEKSKIKNNQQSIINEIKAQQALNYSKVVKIKSYSENAEKVYIIQELCKNRALSDLVKKRGHLTEIEVQSYMFQIIQGLKYIHNNNIIHRDLKPNNIFISDKMELKIGDFGLIAKVTKDNDRQKDCCGTIHYMAPEVFNPGEKGYSYEVDIWSIGIIMYNLLSGKLPFDSENPIKEEREKEIKNLVLNGKFEFPNKDLLKQDIDISDVAKNLITQILQIDVKKRPGLNQILYHDFFHLGKFPEFPKSFTLKRAPTLDEIHKYNKDADIEGRINKEVKQKTLYKLIVRDYPEIKYKDIDKYTLDNEQEDSPIENWVSFSHKSHYGFLYYEMNNGFSGVIYKKQGEEEEKTFEGLHLVYYEETDKLYNIKNENYEDSIEVYKIDETPPEIKNYKDEFLSYRNKIRQKLNDLENESQKPEQTLNENNSNSISYSSIDNNSSSHENNSNSSSIENIANNINTKFGVSTKSSSELKPKVNNKLIYIRSFLEEKYAKFFTLSDSTKQIVFKDKIEIFISDKYEKVGYVDKEKKKTFLPLSNILKNSNKDLLNRLKYIKQINYRFIKKKMENKQNKNKNHEKEESNNGDENN